MTESKVTFETAIAELEKIVASLEKGEMELDASLALYQRGVELAKFCNHQLEDAEKKITVLIEKENGNILEENFELSKD